MSKIINNIEELKTVVKISASMPWESIAPFVADAADIYIEPHTGSAILALAEGGTDPDLAEKVRRALGPLTLCLATDELGILYGDAGITVDNVQGKRSPANEAKIAAARQNLFTRGMAALDRLLSWLEAHRDRYPGYADHRAAAFGTPCMIRSAEEFQNVGLVCIDLSTLTYRSQQPLLCSLQDTHIRPLLGEALYRRLLSEQELTAREIALKALVIRYMAHKCAELLTSQASRRERAQPGSAPEYKPLVRPLYGDLHDTGNWFARQAAAYLGELQRYLAEHGGELGTATAAGVLEYNAKEKKIFTTVF